MAWIRLILNRGKTKLVKANHERDARLDPRYGTFVRARGQKRPRVWAKRQPSLRYGTTGLVPATRVIRNLDRRLAPAALSGPVGLPRRSL